MHQSAWYKDPLDEYSQSCVHQDVDWADGRDGDNTLNQTSGSGRLYLNGIKLNQMMTSIAWIYPYGTVNLLCNHMMEVTKHRFNSF